MVVMNVGMCRFVCFAYLSECCGCHVDILQIGQTCCLPISHDDIYVYSLVKIVPEIRFKSVSVGWGWRWRRCWVESISFEANFPFSFVFESNKQLRILTPTDEHHQQTQTKETTTRNREQTMKLSTSTHTNTIHSVLCFFVMKLFSFSFFSFLPSELLCWVSFFFLLQFAIRFDSSQLSDHSSIKVDNQQPLRTQRERTNGLMWV